MKNYAIYPGTFDPITFGHVDLVKRALRLFDQVVIAIAHNHAKNPLFSLEERLQLIKEVLKEEKNVEVTSFEGLISEFSKKRGIRTIIRGLRVISDFDYEFQMASTNRTLFPDLETVFLMPADRYTYTSSNLVREIAASHGDVSSFVPKEVAEALAEKG